MTTFELVDHARLSRSLESDTRAYRDASPFPCIVLDDVLLPDALRAAQSEFPSIRNEFWQGYLHVNETKYSNTQPDSWGGTLRSVAEEFCSDEFVAYLEQLTGITGLVSDWSMDGGGLHQTLRGGHLNIHADFTTHHTNPQLQRRVNILLYLNEEWLPDWGGELELWDADMTGCQARVTPAGNRMLVFTTTADSFHGHPDPLTCPPDVARRSMALYYFTVEDNPTRHSTNYRARPHEGAFGRAAIAVDRVALDVYDRTKRRLGIDDERVTRLLARANAVFRKK